MNQLRNYIRLMRVKHYIKNILIFMPLFFAGKIYDWNELSVAVTGFFAFCCVSSSVYIFKVLVNNCVGDFVWRFMQSLESLYL